MSPFGASKSHRAVGIANNKCNNKSAICRARCDFNARKWQWNLFGPFKSHRAVGIAHKECNNKSAICRARCDLRSQNWLQSWPPKCPWSPEASKCLILIRSLITKGTLFGASNFWRYVADISIIIFIFIFIFPLHVHFHLHLRLRLWNSCQQRILPYDPSTGWDRN